MSDCYVWLVCYQGQRSTYEHTCGTYDEAVALMEKLKAERPEVSGWHVVEKDVS